MFQEITRQEFLALKERASLAAKKVRKEEGNICLVSHYDADGISAAAIMHRCFDTAGKSFEVNFIRQLDADAAKQISEKDASLWIFTDIGSGQLDILKNYFSDKKIIVLDHHPIYGNEWKGLVHVNPFLEGINGTKYISGAGVVYLVARGISSSARSMVEFAVAGACGDMQFVNGKMQGINSILLEEAEVSGRIKVEVGLLAAKPGYETKFLYQMLSDQDDIQLHMSVAIKKGKYFISNPDKFIDSLDVLILHDYPPSSQTDSRAGPFINRLNSRRIPALIILSENISNMQLESIKNFFPIKSIRYSEQIIETQIKPTIEGEILPVLSIFEDDETEEKFWSISPPIHYPYSDISFEAISILKKSQTSEYYVVADGGHIIFAGLTLF